MSQRTRFGAEMNWGRKETTAAASETEIEGSEVVVWGVMEYKPKGKCNPRLRSLSEIQFKRRKGKEIETARERD